MRAEFSIFMQPKTLTDNLVSEAREENNNNRNPTSISNSSIYPKTNPRISNSINLKSSHPQLNPAYEKIKGYANMQKTKINKTAYEKIKRYAEQYPDLTNKQKTTINIFAFENIRKLLKAVIN